MSAADDNVRYSADHLWLRRGADRVTIGVTENVSRILTWVNAVILPPPGTRLEAGEELATIDSQKTAISLPAPVALEVLGVNDALTSDPMLVRMEPRTAGWLVAATLEDADWERLLDLPAYEGLDQQGGGEAA
jgi:glycine cleavage system H protein